ncbi:MAG TPA: universal stress protein [Bryobacteraceae bacterium]|nr:universal stress protein [Bryobacteraceae bacterium]
MLRLCEAEEDGQSRGRLKVFLGYASGVGKSFRMFDEGRRRKERGEDVVIGAIQPKTSGEVAEIIQKIEVVPLRHVDGSPVMDIPALLARHPGVCLVDGLAYDNPVRPRDPFKPVSHNSSRWEDVRDLLAAGVSVITTINIQYIAELRERVETLTHKHVGQTVPRNFLYNADEIVVVDAPPDATFQGFGSTGEEDAVRARRLSELREIALLLAADVVDRQLESYLRRNGLSTTLGAQERILVCVTPRANARPMIESGRRNADRFHGELIVAYVRQPDLRPEDQAALDGHLAVARAARAQIEILDGDEAVEAILDFARERGVTQIFVGHSLQKGWLRRLRGSHVDRIIRGADGMDVRVFPH